MRILKQGSDIDTLKKFYADTVDFETMLHVSFMFFVHKKEMGLPRRIIPTNKFLRRNFYEQAFNFG